VDCLLAIKFYIQTTFSSSNFHQTAVERYIFNTTLQKASGRLVVIFLTNLPQKNSECRFLTSSILLSRPICKEFSYNYLYIPNGIFSFVFVHSAHFQGKKSAA